MKFTLTISCDNAAFEDDREGEIVRLLQVAIKKVEHCNQSGSLFDINGNSVGTFKFSDSNSKRKAEFMTGRTGSTSAW